MTSHEEREVNRTVAGGVMAAGLLLLAAPVVLFAATPTANEVAGYPVFSWIGGGLGITSLIGGAIMWGKNTKSVEVIEKNHEKHERAVKEDLQSLEARLTAAMTASEERTRQTIAQQGEHFRSLVAAMNYKGG